MKDRFTLDVVDALDPEFDRLAKLARSEDFRFMDTLIDRWRDGSNRFDQPGEVYLAVRRNGRLIAAGGLNRDPYCQEPGTGRVRHVYVEPDVRRSGAGRLLVEAIVDRARDAFKIVRLRTQTQRGALFYEALGFVRCDDPTATHRLAL